MTSDDVRADARRRAGLNLDPIQRKWDAWNEYRLPNSELLNMLSFEVPQLIQEVKRERSLATQLLTELDRAKSAAKTLGGIVEQQGQDVLRILGRDDLIDENGDGDWGLAWELLSELPAERDAARVKLDQAQDIAKWLIAETIWNLRIENDKLEIVNGWLVQRNVHPLEYPLVEYGPLPYSDAEPLVDLNKVPGWVDNDSVEAERDAALAVIAQVRDLAADVDQDGGHSGPTLARHILNIIGGEA